MPICDRCKKEVLDLDMVSISECRICRACDKDLEQRVLGSFKVLTRINSDSVITTLRSEPARVTDAQKTAIDSSTPHGKSDTEGWKEEDKGCTRREFAIWWLSLLVAVSIVSFVIGLVAPSLVLLAYIVCFIACLINLVLICERLRNTGHSGWWVLLLFVPIINIFLLIYCFVSPENSKFAQKNVNA